MLFCALLPFADSKMCVYIYILVTMIEMQLISVEHQTETFNSFKKSLCVFA